MGLTSLPKRGEGQVLGPIKAESSLNLWDRLRRVFTSEWNGNAKGLEEVCEEVGLHDGSTEGSLVARVNALEGGSGSAPGGEWETTPVPATGNTYYSLSRPSWTRSGGGAVAAGNVVTLTHRLELDVALGELPSIVFDGLPCAPDTSDGVFPLRTVVSQLYVRMVGGTTYLHDWDAVFVIESGVHKIRLFSTNATGEISAFEISMTCTYVAQGPG